MTKHTGCFNSAAWKHVADLEGLGLCTVIHQLLCILNAHFLLQLCQGLVPLLERSEQLVVALGCLYASQLEPQHTQSYLSSSLVPGIATIACA